MTIATDLRRREARGGAQRSGTSANRRRGQRRAPAEKAFSILATLTVDNSSKKRETMERCPMKSTQSNVDVLRRNGISEATRTQTNPRWKTSDNLSVLNREKADCVDTHRLATNASFLSLWSLSISMSFSRVEGSFKAFRCVFFRLFVSLYSSAEVRCLLV